MVSLKPSRDKGAEHPPEVQTHEERIEQLKQKNSEAWSHVFDDCLAELQNFVNNRLWKAGLVGDDKTRDDVISATWATAIEKIDDIHYLREGSIQKWLHAIAQLHILKLRHKTFKSRSQSIEAFDNETELDNFLSQNGLYQEGAENEMELQERTIALDAALRQLNSRDREIFMRRIINRESPADLAKEYGMNVQAVYKLIDRAKKNIQSQMNMRGFFRKSNQ